MDMLIDILFAGLLCYASYRWGLLVGRTSLATATIDSVISKTKFPVGIIEKIEGHYYLYEKDTNNFLCQAESLEEIPQKLFEAKKITLAAVMCPEETNAQVYWCVNGKLKSAIQ